MEIKLRTNSLVGSVHAGVGMIGPTPASAHVLISRRACVPHNHRQPLTRFTMPRR